MSRGRAFLVILATLFCADAARADHPLAFREATVGAIRIDGALRDWRRVRFTAVGEGGDASFEYALAYDGDNLYLAARVSDERLVIGRDALELGVFLPTNATEHEGSDVVFLPGEPGRARSQVALRNDLGREEPITSAQVVEGPLGGGPGYVIEARVPWAAIPGGDLWPLGSARLVMRDVDSEAHPEVEGRPATSSRPLRVRPDGVFGLPADFLERNGVQRHARFLARADVGGDLQKELVAVVGPYVIVTGPGYSQHGLEYFELGSEEGIVALQSTHNDDRPELIATSTNPEGGPTASQILRLDAPPISVLVTRRIAGVAAPVAPHTPGAARAPGTPSTPRAPRTVAAPEQPVAPSRAEVLRALQRATGVDTTGTPLVRIVANVAAEPDPEEVLVFAGALVALGSGFGAGAGYFFYQLPVARPEDFVSLSAQDLTDDGRAELLLRVKQTSGDVLRELLFVHRFTRTGFDRALVVEVARRSGERFVENEVRVVSRRGVRRLTILPGRARGFSATHWPFAEGSGEGIAPLLLPWRDQPMRYVFTDGALEPVPLRGER